MTLSKTSLGMSIFKSISFNKQSLLGAVGRHSFPSGYGVSVLRLKKESSDHYTVYPYTHSYEVMLTYNNELLNGEDTPLTQGESLRFDGLDEVVDFIEQAAQLEPIKK